MDNETVLIRQSHPYARGTFTGILLTIMFACLYLIVAWRYPSLLPDPDEFLNHYPRQENIEVDPSLKQQVPDLKLSLIFRRTDKGWQTQGLQWKKYLLPTPHPIYPIYYSESHGLLYVHRIGDRLRVIHASHEGLVTQGPPYQRIPFFGTAQGGWEVIQPETIIPHVAQGNGGALYIGENSLHSYAIEDDRQQGPYQFIDSPLMPTANKADSPIFLARRNGHCLIVVGNQEYLR